MVFVVPTWIEYIFVIMNKRKVFVISAWIAGSFIATILIFSAILLVFKDDIKKYALEEANKYLNKQVHVGYIDIGFIKTFPSVTLSFDDVLVHSRYDTIQTLDTAIYAKKIDLRFNPLDFFKGKYDVNRIDVSDAILNLSVLEEGLVNYDFLTPSENEKATPFEFNLEKINLINTDFSYSNKATEQFYSGYFKSLNLEGSFTEKQFVLDAKTTFDVKKINSKSVTLIENQAAECHILIKMDQINDVFAIKAADLKINKLPFNIQGEVSQDSINFYIGAKELNLVDVANNFSLQELDVVNKVQGKGQVNFELFIKGKRENTTAPAINADFNIKNGSLTDQGFSLTNINVEGSYSNGANQKEEQILLSKINFITLNEQFSGRVSIKNFDKPRLTGKAKGRVDLSALHRLFGPFGMTHLSGNIAIDGDFDFGLNSSNFHYRNIRIYHLTSKVNFSNITAQFVDDERILKLQKGGVVFSNHRATVSDLLFSLNNSSLHLEGDINNITNYFNGKEALVFSANLSSEALFIDDLAAQNETPKVKDWILPDDILGKLRLNLKKVEYSGHQYKEIKGDVHLNKHEINFPNIEGVLSGAHVKGNLKIVEQSPMYILVETNLKTNKLLFSPIFKEWNNFNQHVITADNIRGQASASVHFKSPFDLFKGEIVMKDLEATAKIGITNGALVGVKTFKEITESLRESGANLLISRARINDFEKRLLNLQFDSFENEFTIKNGVLTIPKMDIRSNALDVSLEGTHSFNNDIDYAFNFRFREIKGDAKSDFGDIVDDGTGFRVFLKMYGNLNSPQFSWDREAKRTETQERREQAKDDFKSAIKTGFGINKGDSTIQRLEQNQPKEDRVIMEFEEDKKEEEQEEKKKKGIFSRWEKENEKPKPEFEIEQ